MYSGLGKISLFLFVLLFSYAELDAQSRHRAFILKEVEGQERRSKRSAIDIGSKLVILQKTTTKRDRYGTLARIRLFEQAEFPENDRSGFEVLADEIIEGSRSRERYSLTDAGSNVYFIYVLTPENHVLESVAWSTTRKLYEPAFERFVGQEVDTRKVSSSSRRQGILQAFFGGAAQASVAAIPETENDLAEDNASSETNISNQEETIVVPPEQADYSAGSDVGLKVILSELTGDDQVPLRSLPVGSKVAMFNTKAAIESSGYTSIPLPNSELSFPESTEARPTFAALESGATGPVLSRQLQKTDIMNPDAYFFYVLSPSGKLFQSVGNSGSYYVPAYETARTGSFIMSPVLDTDRIERVKSLYWEEKTDSTWWMWLLGGVLGFALIGFLLSWQNKRKDKKAEKEWKEWVKDGKDSPRKQVSKYKEAPAPILDGRFKIFEKADDAYFYNELEPLLSEDQRLRDNVVLYRKQIKENIESIFLEDFEKGFIDAESDES